MRPRTGILLFVIGMIVLAGGWYLGEAGEAFERPASQASGTLLFPDLSARLAQAQRIELAHADKKTVLVRKRDAWGLADRDGYPVKPDRLHALLTGLAELRLREPRTANPALFVRLGVDDPGKAGVTGTLISVLDGAGKPIASVIAGHESTRMRGNAPASVYVRLPGQDQSWLADGTLDADPDPALWLDRDILSIPPARVASVVSVRGDAQVTFGRDGEKLVVKQPADHPPLESYKVEDVGRALDGLGLQDVKAAKDMPGPETGHAVFTTDDGLTLTITLARAGKDLWAHFAATGEGKARAEADKLNARLGPWAYQLGTWKESALDPTVDDLKSAPPKPETPAPAPGKP